MSNSPAVCPLEKGVRFETYRPLKSGGFRLFLNLRAILWADDQTTRAGFRWNGCSAPIGRQRGFISSARHDQDYGKIIKARKSGLTDKSAERMRKDADKRYRRYLEIYDNQKSWVRFVSYYSLRMLGASHARTDKLNEQGIKNKMSHKLFGKGAKENDRYLHTD